MQTKPMILKLGGIGSILCGLIILAFTLIFVRMVTQLDMSYLVSRYGPNDGHTYEDLYELAKQIGNSSAATKFTNVPNSRFADRC